jgi:hypothetical protein
MFSLVVGNSERMFKMWIYSYWTSLILFRVTTEYVIIDIIWLSPYFSRVWNSWKITLFLSACHGSDLFSYALHFVPNRKEHSYCCAQFFSWKLKGIFAFKLLCFVVFPCVVFLSLDLYSILRLEFICRMLLNGWEHKRQDYSTSIRTSDLCL